MGTIMSLTDIFKRLDIKDPVEIEYLKNLIRNHWQRDSRCPTNWFTAKIKTSRSSLSLDLARELIDMPEYRSHFEGKRNEKSIRLLSNVYRTQWKYNKDNNGRRNSTYQPNRSTATKARKTTWSGRHHNEQVETCQETMKSDHNNLSRVSQEAEQTQREILSQRQAERQTSEPDMEDIQDILRTWVRSSSAPERSHSEPSETMSHKCNKIETSEDVVLNDPSNESDAKESLMNADHSQESTSTLSSGLSSKQDGPSFDINMNGETHRYKGEALARTINAFAIYVDRVHQEGRDVSSDRIISMFYGMFVDFAADPLEAEEIYCDGAF